MERVRVEIKEMVENDLVKLKEINDMKMEMKENVVLD